MIVTHKENRKLGYVMYVSGGVSGGVTHKENRKCASGAAFLAFI